MRNRLTSPRTPAAAQSKLLPYIFTLNAARVRHRLLEWFDSEGRSFPWRSVERARERPHGEPIHDPYMILVSEVMLQQTQTSRVVEKLPLFLEKFPDVHALAGASRGELIRAWQGMGYNRRVLRLQDAALAVIERYEGEFPRSVEELASFPGVGRYTASAVACFAFGEDVPVVDVNVIRVLSRLFFKCHSAEQVASERAVIPIADAINPPGDSYRWHQALMDFGATICTARRPACERCPLVELCLSAFPAELSLFGERHAARPEPEIRGEPRRIWRGRIVEILRRAHTPLHAGEIIDSLIPHGLFSDRTTAERREMLKVMEGLLDDGLIERPGVVREGGIGEGDMIVLPR